MNFFKKIGLFSLLILSTYSSYADSPARNFPPGVADIFITDNPNINTDSLKKIAPIVEKSIAKGFYPGAIVLVGYDGNIIYRGVFGNRRIVPNIAPMQFDTIFDIASLTKVVATTPAIMQLVEQGKLKLDAPVAKYWPQFAANGKEKITVRELLTHMSGLAADIPSHGLNKMLPPAKRVQADTITDWQSEQGALAEVIKIKPEHRPGKVFVYSDINFITLGYLVKLLSGEPIDQYTVEHIYQPLGMKETFYQPPITLRDRIAPTQIVDGVLRWGIVHDPTTFQMGGVSGVAGLFSTANDLAIYAQSLLDHGKLPNNAGKTAYFLSAHSVKQMTSRQTPRKETNTRGLGWDINSVFSSRGKLLSPKSYGHTGYAGTSLLIDPVNKVYIIMLTSRTHPTPTDQNQLVFDRRDIADLVANSINYLQRAGVAGK